MFERPWSASSGDLDSSPWAGLLRSRAAEALLFGMLALSPVKLDAPRIEPPPAAVLPIGEPMPGLDPWGRRLAASVRLRLGP